MFYNESPKRSTPPDRTRGGDLAHYTFSIGVLVCVLAVGCGASAAPLGASGTAQSPPVELNLRSAEGTEVEVAGLRGRRVLVFLFATFDGVSQASLHALRGFVERQQDFYVLGIAVQPNPEQLLDAWNAALTPPFVTTYEEGNTIQEGLSDLGEFDSVPTLLLLDEEGRVTGRYVGMVERRNIEQLVGMENVVP